MIRIGHNPNTNMLPMFFYLPCQHPLLRWVTAEPTGHNAMLADGRIDMAPISSYAYGCHSEEYAILPGLSVSTKGKVGSILLFSKVPLAQLDGRKVALTSNSATSVHLTQIILERFYEVKPVYETMSGGLAEMLAKADAALLIADMALKEAMAKPDCLIYDLGEEWLRQTGFSMTYAVWAYPKDLILKLPQEVLRVQALLMEAKGQALQNLDGIVEACIGMLGGEADFWRDYFAGFRYNLDEELMAGLEHYYALCYEQGFFSIRPGLNIWPPVK